MHLRGERQTLEGTSSNSANSRRDGVETQEAVGEYLAFKLQQPTADRTGEETEMKMGSQFHFSCWVKTPRQKAMLGRQEELISGI